MKFRGTTLAVAAASMLSVTQVQAAEGYWDDAADSVWRSGSGECWHTGSWTMDMAIVGCDGVVEEVVEVVEVVMPPAVTAAAGTVNFAFDSADLNPASKAAVDSLVGQVKSKGSINLIKLSGHTDRIGTEEYNLDLSLRRAGAVAAYLTENAGLDPQIIEISGKGESNPVVGCEGVRGAALIECLAPNRRAQIDLDIM